MRERNKNKRKTLTPNLGILSCSAFTGHFSFPLMFLTGFHPLEGIASSIMDFTLIKTVDAPILSIELLHDSSCSFHWGVKISHDKLDTKDNLRSTML